MGVFTPKTFYTLRLNNAQKAVSIGARVSRSHAYTLAQVTVYVQVWRAHTQMIVEVCCARAACVEQSRVIGIYFILICYSSEVFF